MATASWHFNNMGRTLAMVFAMALHKHLPISLFLCQCGNDNHFWVSAEDWQPFPLLSYTSPSSCVTRVFGTCPRQTLLHVMYAYIIWFCIAWVARSCDIIITCNQPLCCEPNYLKVNHLNVLDSLPGWATIQLLHARGEWSEDLGIWSGHARWHGSLASNVDSINGSFGILTLASFTRKISTHSLPFQHSYTIYNIYQVKTSEDDCWPDST
jgi:hypothetical protein